MTLLAPQFFNRKFWGAATAILCVTVACEGYAQSPRALEPETAVLLVTEDFGEVEPGNLAVRPFKVRNDTEHVMRLIDHRRSCGCISVKESPESIQPGETAVIKLAYETEGAYGKVTQSVLFKLEHPKFGVLRLQLSGLVPGIWTLPQEVDFGALTANEPAKREFFVIASGRAASTKLERVHLDNPNLEVELEPAVVSDEQQRKGQRALGKVIVRWKGAGKPELGRMTARAKVMTNDPLFPEVAVQVGGHVVGDYRVSPCPIVFGSVSPGKEVIRICSLSEAGEKRTLKAADLTVRSNHPAIQAEIVPPKEGDLKIRLRLVLSGDRFRDEAALQKGSITVLTDGKPIISIPYLMFQVSKPD